MSRKASGFTLIEMLIVVTIIAVLAGVGSTYYSESIEDARISTVKTNLKIVRDAISRHFKDHMTYPTSLESLQGPYLLQPVAAILVTPFQDKAVVLVEVASDTAGNVYPVDYNVFHATQTTLIPYSLHIGRQIKNIRIKYDGTEMNW